MVVFSCPPSELFLFPFACCCCVFMACPALLTAHKRLCWISRLTGDLFLVCHLLLRWIVFPVFLLLNLFVPSLSVVWGGVRFPGEFGSAV